MIVAIDITKRHLTKCASRANQFFKLDGLVEMVTRLVSEDFNGFLANASGYQNTQFQKLICPECASNLEIAAIQTTVQNCQTWLFGFIGYFRRFEFAEHFGELLQVSGADMLLNSCSIDVKANESRIATHLIFGSKFGVFF